MPAHHQPLHVDAELIDDYTWTLSELAGQLRDRRDAEATWLADLFDRISHRAYEHSIRSLGGMQPRSAAPGDAETVGVARAAAGALLL